MSGQTKPPRLKGGKSAISDAIPEPYYREAIRRLLSMDAATPKAIQDLKLQLSRELGAVGFPSNADILARCTPGERARLQGVLRMKPTRSVSGVTIVTVQSSPEACPHGKCVYCPGGPEFGTAQSYTGLEPAARRAARHAFDPYGQTAGRLADLTATGHPVDKVDFIIQGGTFTARDETYQRWFVERAFDALNAYGGAFPGEGASLAEAQERNERAKARMIGLTIETKPDWARESHVDLSLELGCTRMELGVQALDDEILRLTNRGHTLKDTVESFRVVKDAGLKLCAHVMPGQPGSSYEKDLATFRDLFQDPRYGPDMLKIYPTLVIPGTPLATLMERGKFTPVTEEYVVDLLAEVKPRLPRWVRIQRVERDIPSTEIVGGVKKLNVREMVHARLEAQGKRCNCIRCREAGHKANKEKLLPQRIERSREDYRSAGGREHFLSLEDPDQDILVGFIRLREPSPEAHRPEVESALLLRELKVFGSEVPLGARPESPAKFQHRGFGSDLTGEAEALAKERGLSRVVVTAGVGVREYYRKLGYERMGPYMAKAV